MGKAAAAWAKQVEPHLGFLAEHGFTRVTTDDSSFWSIWAQYASDRAAVRVSRSNEFRRAEIELIRLAVDGEVPTYPIWITSERIDWMLLDNVLEARRPDLRQQALPMTGLQPAELDAQLRFWAHALRETCPDFLAGDFTAIDEAAVLIRHRVHDHPQEIVAWLPEDSHPTAEAAALEDMAATVPPEVGVRVRRFRRTGKDRG